MQIMAYTPKAKRGLYYNINNVEQRDYLLRSVVKKVIQQRKPFAVLPRLLNADLL